MKHLMASGIVALAALGGCVSLRAQTQVPAPSQAVAVSPSPGEVLVPAGTQLGLELQDSLNSKFTQKGERVTFKVSPDVTVGDHVAIARDSTVDATVAVARRAGPTRRKGEIRLEFEKLVLTDGPGLPLAARITRVGRWNRSDKITPTAPGDRDVMQDVSGLVQMAGLGALLGSMGGGSAAAIGAGAGAAIGIAAILMERGPEVDLAPGIMFQIELTKPLKIPAGARVARDTAAGRPAPPALPAQTAEPLATSATAVLNSPKPVPDDSSPLKTGIPPAETAGVAVNPGAPPPPVPVAQPADIPAAGNEPVVTFKTEVNLVTVEATVRDARGAIYIKLKREDFRVLENGVEQPIRHFSRDELPLSVALVIDRSGSVAPILQQLRRAGYQTLSQLKTGDQVALFAFDSRCERLMDLTADRRLIADRIAMIQAGGGTNLTDTLLEVARYLGSEAPERRHAIILVSDNQQTVAPLASEAEVIRTALETETVVYSVKIADRSRMSMGTVPFPVQLPRSEPVKKIAEETGGEVFDIRELGSVESAMQAVISRLKLRFTLGYHSADMRPDGAFRRIDVRLTKKDPLAEPFTLYHRRGYYALRPEKGIFLPSSSNSSGAAAWGQPSPGGAVPAAAPDKNPSKPLTNDDVLKLVQAGFGEDTILEAIRTSECRFDTSADALVKLKNAGVSEKIIQAMLAAGGVNKGSPASGTTLGT